MHPIEHLRHLARVDSSEAAGLVAETATALGSLRNDPATLVVACRRILERHASVGPMWWLCSHLLLAADPGDRSWELADEVASDATPGHLAARLAPDSHVLTGGIDLTLIEAVADRGDVTVACLALGDAVRLVRRAARFGVPIEPLDTSELSDAAARCDAAVISLRAGSPAGLLVARDAALVARTAAAAGTPVWLVAPTGTCLPDRYVTAIGEAGASALSELEPSLIAAVIGPAGFETDVTAAVRPTAPMAPELLRVTPSPVGAR